MPRVVGCWLCLLSRSLWLWSLLEAPRLAFYWVVRKFIFRVLQFSTYRCASYPALKYSAMVTKTLFILRIQKLVSKTFLLSSFISTPSDSCHSRSFSVECLSLQDSSLCPRAGSSSPDTTLCCRPRLNVHSGPIGWSQNLGPSPSHVYPWGALSPDCFLICQSWEMSLKSLRGIDLPPCSQYCLIGSVVLVYGHQFKGHTILPRLFLFACRAKQNKITFDN